MVVAQQSMERTCDLPEDLASLRLEELVAPGHVGADVGALHELHHNLHDAVLGAEGVDEHWQPWVPVQMWGEGCDA